MRISDWSSDVCSSDLARRLGGEIVNADSQQVYRGLDVGTAKPTSAERAAVPHHLLDVVEPGEGMDAARFAALADAAIARSEERRVGKECVRKCRSRWSPYLYKKK